MNKGGVKLLSGLEEYDAFCDFNVSNNPGWCKKLDEEYPDSKFILTVRALDEWLLSRENHVKWNRIDPDYTGLWLEVDKDKWKRECYRHNRSIINYFKDRPGDLLVINICKGQGWEYLCPYLGRPIPSVPFPHINKSSEFSLK